MSDHGRFSEAVNLDLNVGKLSSYTSYQRQQSDGWKLHPMTETVNKKGEVKLDPTDKQAFTGYHSNTVNQSFSYSLNHKTTLYAQGSYYNFLNDRPVTEYKYNMYHENYTYGFGMKYIVNKKAYIDADFYSDNYKSAYDYIQESGDFKIGDKETRKKQYFYRGNVRTNCLPDWNIWMKSWKVNRTISLIRRSTPWLYMHRMSGRLPNLCKQ